MNISRREKGPFTFHYLFPVIMCTHPCHRLGQFVYNDISIWWFFSFLDAYVLQLLLSLKYWSIGVLLPFCLHIKIQDRLHLVLPDLCQSWGQVTRKHLFQATLNIPSCPLIKHCAFSASAGFRVSNKSSLSKSFCKVWKSAWVKLWGLCKL